MCRDAGSGARSVLTRHGRPREHGRDDEVALAHMVGDLELEVREAGGFGGEDVRAVVAIAWRTA
jgi:hypothetical protein